MPDQLNKINPQITSVEIGTRNLRKIEIYPLSIGDEIKFADLITEAISVFVDKGMEDEKTIPFIVDLIKDNLSRIIDLVTMERGKKAEKLMSEITNMQATNIAAIIWRVNFEDPSKNVISLLNQIKTQYQLGGQQQPFANDTDTNFMKSSEQDIVKEDLPKDN